MASRQRAWAGVDSALCSEVTRRTQANLRVYRDNPDYVDEHASIEHSATKGGYERRQVHELIQNAADELIGHPGGRVEVRLAHGTLYCANQGSPFAPGGVRALLQSHLSPKEGNEIGRFGLGFKSVIEITDRPSVVSRSGSFEFDSDRAKREIEAVSPGHEMYPVLRTAWPLDPNGINDPNVLELMAWASTVVVLPLRSATDRIWLAEVMSEFPAEFLLFSPHVGELILRVEGESRPRRIRVVAADDTRVEVHEGRHRALWHVFGTSHEPSEAARKQGGLRASRASVPVQWAVCPEHNAGSRGQFWAFYPTSWGTTLSGILNAPWKTNDDRTALLEGVFNDELISVAARLVAESFGKLPVGEDPGRLLELLPGRGAEDPEGVARTLASAIYQELTELPAVPDQEGVLRPVASLRFHQNGIPKKALEMWSRAPGRPSDWVHPSVYSATRRSRVERLQGVPSYVSVEEWLRAIVRLSAPETSKSAILVAECIAVDTGTTRLLWDQVGASRVLMTTNSNRLVALNEPAIFLTEPEDARARGVQYVHPELESDDHVRRVLVEHFGKQALDPAGRVRALLSGSTPASLDWRRFWGLAARVAPAATAEVLHECTGFDGEARVLTCSGEFKPLGECLLPGFVSGEGEPDVVVDMHFHSAHLEHLRQLGCVERPVSMNGIDGYHRQLLREYESTCRREYLVRLRETHITSIPHESKLRFLQKRQFAGPLGPLEQLSDGSKALYCEELLALGGHEQWVMRHSSLDKYPAVRFDNPTIWAIRRRGLVPTSWGAQPVDTAVSPGAGDFGEFVPSAQLGASEVRLLGLPESTEQFSPDLWRRITQRFSRATCSLEPIERFLEVALERMGKPRSVPAIVGKTVAIVARRDVCLVGDKTVSDALRETSRPHLVVRSPDLRARLIERWNVAELAQGLEYVPSGPRVRLLEEYPELEAYANDEQLSLDLQRCERLCVSTSEDGAIDNVSLPVYVQAGCVFASAQIEDDELLRQLSDHLQWGLSDERIAFVLGEARDERTREVIARLQGACTDAERIQLLVSEDGLRRALPGAVVRSVEAMSGQLGHEGLAQLALAVYGLDVLKQLAPALTDAGMWVPGQWAGRRPARRFVEDLGFTKEYAGFSQPPREPQLEVDGPSDIGELHDYQRELVSRIADLLDGEPRRGLLALPTGAGKTRTAVEAVIRLQKDSRLLGPTLWIAQTDELCEQAVQTFRRVWRNLGSNETLTISRLWASNQVFPVAGGPQVVVATVAKLHCLIGVEDYSWLGSPALLVMDEAHETTSSEYRDVLSWLGFRVSRSEGKDPCPVVGLTATHFKSSDAATQKLAKLYDGELLSGGVLGVDPYRELQRRKILCEVDHNVLPGVDVDDLTESEIANREWSKDLPPRVLQRIAEDAVRNKAILESICELPEDWKVLVFAISVAHAQSLAALLAMKGVSAAAVSADTARGARRHYVREFMSGSVRVLINHSVFKAGFDAPDVRALYIVRPTYSPVDYQQMVGRGLRGSANGGTDRCLLVNVGDNVAQWGKRLAFNDFDYIWER